MYFEITATAKYRLETTGIVIPNVSFLLPRFERAIICY